MQASKMKNTVILKNIPSNIVDEAIVILKNNKTIKAHKYIKNSNENDFTKENEKENFGEYIINEAELVISDYINKIENYNYKSQKIDYKNKYKKLKKTSIVMSLIIIALSIALIIK